MPYRKPLLATVLLALGLAAGSLQAQEQQAQATFVNAQGKSIGTATLTQKPGGVLIDISVSGVPAGTHAFHIHETGKCDTPDFKSAGEHYNPGKAPHGYGASREPHAGDMPNQFVQEDGILRTQVLNPQVTLGAGKATVFDTDGSALVIHAQADDYTSQPAGAAGDRFACAVIMPR
ncbi:MAG: superoxide dismutase family protein [Candidatus Tectimicrobiota bacterium]